jgi:hypothetical protein
MKEDFLDFEHSTIRKSDAVANEWKTKMTKKYIDNITEICEPVLKMLKLL